MDYKLWFELILFIILMGLSGFFSSSETALFSLSNAQLEQMRRNNHPRINLIERILSLPRRLIVTILIGNELVNVSASVLSASVIIELLGGENKFANLFFMVPILLLVGEIIPKTLAIHHNIAFASFEARPLDLFSRLIKPVRWLVRNVADWFITLIIGKERSRGNIITEDMVRTLAHEAVGEGVLDRTEAQFIDHIFDFSNKTLEDMMTPRSSIFFLPIEMPLPEIVSKLRLTRHTKVPIYHQHRDTIIGILHARDLLGVDTEQLPPSPKGLKKLLRQPYFVPESKPAVELFHTFRERQLSLALTVDEYGGVVGLVTMEDLLECIFGDIHSPSDLSSQTYIKQVSEGKYIIDAVMPIADLNQEIGAKLSEEWAETIGGLLLHLYGELPSIQTTITVDDLKCTVVEVGENRIQSVLLEQVDRAEKLNVSDRTKSAATPPPEADKTQDDNQADTSSREFNNEGGA